MNNLYHPLGIIRETPLWGIIILIISVLFFKADFGTIVHLAQISGNLAYTFMCSSIVLYPLFMGLHLLILRLSRSAASTGEILMGAFIHDLGTPFRSIHSLFRFLTKKADFKGRTHVQTAIFAEQSISEWIWTFCMIAFAIRTFLSFS